MSTTELSELTAAIATLEAQRPILGDTVVEAALGPMREKLAALEARTAPDQQRKIATILFADVSGFTALSETMDAELVATFMNDLWALVDGIIDSHGGRVDKHIGDAVMALWGADIVREDDPEQAIRAALAMQSAIEEFCISHSVPLAIRIGVNTGPVLLGQMGTKGEYTAMGDAVNLASRLETAAPVDSVLISHDTYRHVRGVFDVASQELLRVKGKVEPVQTYVVQQAKPRAFRMATRGVEGIETRMIGRDAELLALQNAFHDALDEYETRFVTVVGEAGVGKSRLLYEFDNWLEVQPERVYHFKGRATPNLQNVTLGLLRDMFAYRFDIKDGDSAAVALERFRAGVDGFLTEAQADIVGHSLGFDFSACPAVKRLLGSSDFSTIARAHLVRYFRNRAAAGPLVILLEDIHWADDQSLDMVAYLAATIPEAPMLFLAVTRPNLHERRPNWGEGEAAFQSVTLLPLSKRSSRALVEEILRQVDEVPEALSDLIISTAEGNPFYVEELIKMLIDQGVIVHGTANGEELWQVRSEKLAELKVPPTLTGLLQARLDGLPHPEREMLQQASIIGRLFWDNAVAELAQKPLETVAPLLTAVRDRELVFRREQSSFATSGEYIFKHALLRDVAYETVLLKKRAEFHGRAARWLEAHAGERLNEYDELIAGHYEQAGEYRQAAVYLLRAGKDALQASAFSGARHNFQRVIDLTEPATDHADPIRVESFVHMAEAAHRQGDLAAAEWAAELGLAGARELADARLQASALVVLSRVASDRGERHKALSYALDEALPLAREVGGSVLVDALLSVGVSYNRIGELSTGRRYIDEALALAREMNDTVLEANALGERGLNIMFLGNAELALQAYQEYLDFSRIIGNLLLEARSLNNLGVLYRRAGQYEAARLNFQPVLQMARELDIKPMEVTVQSNLALVDLALGDRNSARTKTWDILRLALDMGNRPTVLYAIELMARILAAEGERGQALQLLWLINDDPAIEFQTRQQISRLFEAWDVGEDESDVARTAAAELDAGHCRCRDSGRRKRMTERDQLEQAIAALEGQRAILGDAVVEAALGPMRKQLDELNAAEAPEQQRKQVTVLFADVVGFTALSETMDAELVATVMNDLWARIDGVIEAHGARIDKHIGDAVMALWGTEAAREDDPEQAIRAALAMQAAVDAFCDNPFRAAGYPHRHQHRPGTAGTDGDERVSSPPWATPSIWPAGWRRPRRSAPSSSATTPIATCAASSTSSPWSR